MRTFHRLRDDPEFALTVNLVHDFIHFKKLFREFPWADKNNWVYLALLDSTLIKARAFADFLCTSSTSRSTDFQATDLLNNWNCEPNLFVKIKFLTNKYVAHYTFDRFVGIDESKIESAESLAMEFDKVQIEFGRFLEALQFYRKDFFDDVTSVVNEKEFD